MLAEKQECICPMMNTKPMLEESDNWPKCLKLGGVTVKIYRHDDHGFWEFIVDWYLGKTRRQKKFSKEDRAMAFAKERLELLCAYKLSLDGMHESDKEAFLVASDLLRPLGIGLVAAVTDYVAAVKVMGEHGSLTLAAQEFAARHRK